MPQSVLDISEDRRRYDEFRRTRFAVPLEDVKAWVASWGSADLVRNHARSTSRGVL
jgi:hypothetical protein